VVAYAALALQVAVHAINRCTDVAACRAHIDAGLARISAQVAGSRQFIGPHLKLAVLPEYFLTGYPLGESVAAWRERACVSADGAEYDRLGRIAQDNGLFLAGNLYETDPHFPELYFQCSFIIADNGDRVLRYRRLVSMFAPTPHDVLDRYLDVYGPDSRFPVADTPLGRLAAVASEEILFPEIARALAFRGAEVLCHSSSEVAAATPTAKHIAKCARALENHVYVISANSSGVLGIDLPNQSVDGGSVIVDFEGRVRVAAAVGESMAAHGDIDIMSLRAWRRRPGMFNLLPRQRLGLFADVYRDDAAWPANTLLDTDGNAVAPERSHFIKTQEAVIRALAERGILPSQKDGARATTTRT